MINPYDVIVDILHIADMDEFYGTYVYDEYVDNHDYDDDTDDDNDHKKDSYTAAGAAPDAGAAPTQTRPNHSRPDQTRSKKILC